MQIRISMASSFQDHYVSTVRWYISNATILNEASPISYIWNVDEIEIQAGGSISILKVIVKIGSKAIRFTNANKEWLSIMVCMNVIGTYIPNVYIFKSMKKAIDYVKKCEPNVGMVM